MMNPNPTQSQPMRPVEPIVAEAVAPVIAPRPTTFVQKLSWFGGKLLDIAESIGEGVVSILGLDDSQFQDVLDNMTEEEMAAAVEVNDQRNAEYKAAGIIPETELPDDLTPEDIGVDLYSTVQGTERYRPLNHGHSHNYDTDIEGGGRSGGNGGGSVEMKPTVSISRPASELQEAPSEAVQTLIIVSPQEETPSAV